MPPRRRVTIWLGPLLALLFGASGPVFATPSNKKESEPRVRSERKRVSEKRASKKRSTKAKPSGSKTRKEEPLIGDPSEDGESEENEAAAEAKPKPRDVLLVYGARVIVYTGPGPFYRPLIVLNSGTHLPVAEKTTTNKHGEFHKVVVRLSTKKKAIGYIPTSAEVRKLDRGTPTEGQTLEMLATAGDATDVVESFEEFPLAERSAQLTYSQFKTERRLITGGILKYIGPGFYIKGHAGIFQTPDHVSPLIGGEFGNDALVLRSLSAFVSFGFGVFLNPKENALFVGSKKDFSNFMVQTAIGLRYNFGALASFALGGTQAALFNANNSEPTFGAIATVEWGL